MSFSSGLSTSYTDPDDVSQSWTTPIPIIDYSSRDYSSVLQDLVSRIPTYLPEWTSRSPNDFGIVLIQLFAYVCDLMHYYIDRLGSEVFLQTATQAQSVLNIASMLDYQAELAVGASVSLQITIGTGVIGPMTIPAGSQFSTVGSITNPAVVFETNTDLTIAGANGATPSVTGTVSATQGTTTTNEPVGTSTGGINQAFPLAKKPVLAGSFTVSVDLGLGPEVWTDVTHLIDAGPTDHVYTTFVDANGIFYIIFGDNTNGYVPPLGSPITCTYRTGVGSTGNVGANTITFSVNAIIGLVSVTNPFAANGGSDAESLQSIRQNAPISLKALGRGVTINDIESLALQAPGVEWASVVEATYQIVNLYIAPFGGGNPTAALQTAVLTFLQPQLMANTTVTILNPTYVPINITATVVVEPNASQSAVYSLVQAALVKYLDLTNTGFGFRVSLGAVYDQILKLSGVNYANITSLNRQMLAVMTSTLTSGNNYTSIACTPLPQAVQSGDSIVINPGGTHTQTVTASGTAAAGATSIPVTSFTANFTYTSGTTIQDTTGVSDAVLLSNEIPTFGTAVLTMSGGLS